jgi:hypothetical protein
MNGLVLPAALYGCETWSPTLREEHKLTVFDGVLLSKIFGPKWDKVTGDCRRPRNKGLHDVYCLSKIIRVIKSRRMRWAVHVARMGERRSAYRVLVRKPEGKKPLGNLRLRLEIIIKTENQE